MRSRNANQRTVGLAAWACPVARAGGRAATAAALPASCVPSGAATDRPALAAAAAAAAAVIVASSAPVPAAVAAALRAAARALPPSVAIAIAIAIAAPAVTVPPSVPAAAAAAAHVCDNKLRDPTTLIGRARHCCYGFVYGVWAGRSVRRPRAKRRKRASASEVPIF